VACTQKVAESAPETGRREQAQGTGGIDCFDPAVRAELGVQVARATGCQFAADRIAHDRTKASAGRPAAGPVLSQPADREEMNLACTSQRTVRELMSVLSLCDQSDLWRYGRLAGLAVL
jgi:hypothetical protein